MVDPTNLRTREWIEPAKPLKQQTLMQRCDRALSTPFMDRLLIGSFALSLVLLPTSAPSSQKTGCEQTSRRSLTQQHLPA